MTSELINEFYCRLKVVPGCDLYGWSEGGKISQVWFADDGAFHLANKLEICVFSKNWTLTAKTHVESDSLPKT